MEPNQLFGGPEECSSNESGWTMYIASPMHGHDVDDDDGGVFDDNVVDDASGDDDTDGDDDRSSSDDDDATGDDSDDSMASDASSGPGHHEIFCGYSEHDSVDQGEKVDDEGDEGRMEMDVHTENSTQGRKQR
ncbi:protein SOB FIVE-LIKE 2-like [Aristolochia californica]|uniref:protein SOB FIVE-LIKE 2-like n=1 Tax=Aristolochia californica TaxID=171875 RepID=UPI0035DAC367